MALLDLFRKDPLKQTAAALYSAAGEQARDVRFFEQLEVADDFDGRFDLLVVHVHMLIRRLRALSDDAKDAQQRLFDMFMNDLDQGLRLSGVGDIGVGHRVKKMTHAYYGRAVAYDAALDDGDRAALEAAIWRNLYRERELRDGVKATIASYMLATEQSLRATGDADIRQGNIAFPHPIAIGEVGS